MEKNRSIIFRVMGSLLVVLVAGAVLFGLTGVLRDPSSESAPPQVEQQKAQPVAAVAPPPPAPVVAPTMQIDGGTPEVAKVETEPFPQFDEEPTGS
jgi:hypothetical protein